MMFDISSTNQKPSKKSKVTSKIPLSNNQKNIILIIISIIAIIGIIIFAIYKKNNENYNNIKLNKDEYIIYTKYEKTDTKYKKEIPYVNMKAEVIKEVNKDIYIFCNDFLELEKSVISYEYDINGIILSLVVKIVDNETEYAPEVYFRTYNINLDTQTVIADEALLDFFKVTDETTESKIKEQFEKFYSNAMEEGYFNQEECNYSCFLKWRGVQNYMDDVNYYVKDGTLIAYKPFIFYSMFGEENYFKDSDFEFTIATSD